MLHGNIMMPFTRDCQRGKCCTVTGCCSRGIAREGEMLHGNNIMMLVHEGLPEGEMLHGNI